MKKRTGITCKCKNFFHLPDDLYIYNANDYPLDVPRDKIITEYNCKYQGFITCPNCDTCI